jgi:dimethylargininase
LAASCRAKDDSSAIAIFQLQGLFSNCLLKIMLTALTHIVSPKMDCCELTFMDRQPINIELAERQHDHYCAFLESHGLRVVKLSENIHCPDSCFVEDTAIVLDELAIITSMGVASRREESPAIERELAKHRELAHIRLPATIEGGDVLRVGKKLFVGLSSRTNAEGVRALAQILIPLGYEVIPVSVKNSLHLKTACTAIDDETLLMNPNWIDRNPFRAFDIVFTPEDEPWAASTLKLGDTVCIDPFSPKSVELVRKRNVKIETLDISEFRKAEAGFSCLSIIFNKKELSPV